MSYDIAFWIKAECNLEPGAIYRRVRGGRAVKGLGIVPLQAVRRVLMEVLPGCEETGNGSFQCGTEDGHVEVQLRPNAVLVDFRNDFGSMEMLVPRLLELGLTMFDPQTPREEQAFPYDVDYAEVSKDPDITYWLDVELSETTTHYFGDHFIIGAQQVNGIDYVFLRAPGPTGPFEVFNSILEGKSSIGPDRMNGGMLDGYGKLVAVIYIPSRIVTEAAGVSSNKSPVRAFSAFADKDHVLYYQEWSPNDSGSFATIITLKSMPSRMKTIVSGERMLRA